MRKKRAIPCSQLLENASSPVFERAQKLHRLEQAVLRLLPDGLAAHCKVMNLRRETLVISATSPAWAARLRFAAPELVKQLRCQFSLNVHTIEVRVLPEAFEIQSVIREKPEMSAASANLLAQTAQGVDHPGLREALYRLAARTRDY